MMNNAFSLPWMTFVVGGAARWGCGSARLALAALCVPTPCGPSLNCLVPLPLKPT